MSRLVERKTRAALLPASFFARASDQIARELLGCVLVTEVEGERTAGRIVETEAYLGYDDPASHAYRGRRHAGNASVYERPGTWYVYRSYGVHWCCNLTCGGPEAGAAVLLRALEPLTGLDVMTRRRRAHGGSVAAPQTLCNGPGRLTQALGITRALDGRPMKQSGARVYHPDATLGFEIALSPRIGITKAADWPLRFSVRGSTHLSRKS